jgi:hypothetical protein
VRIQPGVSTGFNPGKRPTPARRPEGAQDQLGHPTRFCMPFSRAIRRPFRLQGASSLVDGSRG